MENVVLIGGKFVRQSVQKIINAVIDTVRAPLDAVLNLSMIKKVLTSTTRCKMMLDQKIFYIEGWQ